jgi:hypothetical protein
LIGILMASKAWDKRYELPLFPEFNNPWIYGAYAKKLLEESSSPDDLRVRFTIHAMYCQGNEPGFFTRWLGGDGGSTSHDELMGLAYVCEPFVAKKILDRLYARDGVYNPEDKPVDTMWRFIFLEPFLRECAGLPVGLFSQLKWAAHVFWSALTYKSGSSGPLKIWLMGDVMSKYIICHAAYTFWKRRMAKKGPFPQWMFTEHFPAYPELSLLME